MGFDSDFIPATTTVVKQTSVVLHLIFFSTLTKSAPKQLHSLCNGDPLVKSESQILLTMYFKCKSDSEATGLTPKDNFDHYG